jgi:methylated-DNA-protein-cysteine methyltransferase related protein
MMSATDSPSADAIARVVAAIPRGCVTSYGAVATRAGLPGRARLVGRVLGESSERNLPWQRVLRSDGRIALPPRSAGFREQVRLLRAEGVTVVKGKVDLRRFGWAGGDLDSLLWATPGPRA